MNGCEMESDSNRKSVEPIDLRSLDEGRSILTITGVLDRETVPELRRRSFRLLKRKPKTELTIDLSSVESMDTAGVALLVEWYRLMKNRQGRIIIDGLNPVVEEQMRLARLDRLLACQQVS